MPPPTSRPGRGLCLDRHDILVAKLFAFRPKDQEYAAALLRAGLVSAGVLHKRVSETDLTPYERERILGRLHVLGY